MNTKKKKADLIAKYRETLGNVTASCEAVNVGRTTFYSWLKSDPEFREMVEAIDEASIDFAESALKRQIREGNVTAIIFYLKTKGRSRGYVEHSDVRLTSTRPPEEVARDILDAIGGDE